VRSSSEWIAATPLVLCEPTIAQVRHPDFPLATFLDEAHALDASLVAREAAPHVVEETSVDLEDDFEVARMSIANQASGHFLERFGSSVWFV